VVHLRVLTATGIEELDKEIANKLALREIEVAGECYYREGLWGLAEERGADVVVLSPQLPGDGEILEVVKKLRLSGLRVVLLPGRREDEPALKLARRAVALGVYDLVWDPVSPAVVVHRIERPATLAEAGVEPDPGEEPVEIRRPETKTRVQHIKHFFFNSKETKEANRATVDWSKDESLLLFARNSADAIYSLARNKIKKPLVIIDADGNSGLAVKLGLDAGLMWKHDWRTGLSAEPAVINKKVLYYGMDKEIDEKLDDRDIRCLREIILAQAKQNRQVILNAGTRKELLPHLSDLNFKIINL
jgi:hypothetical protein